MERIAYLIQRSHYDSARQVLQPYYAELSAEGMLGTEFGLWLRLHRARIEEREHNFGEAAAQLLPLISEASASGVAEVQAHALLHMALIYEQQDQPERCHDYLVQAEAVIETRQLRQLRARLMNRLSSYERLFGSEALALRYARLAVAMAQEHGLPHEAATGYLLQSILTRTSDPASSEYYLVQAAPLFREHSGAVSYFFVLSNLRQLHMAKKEYARALASNLTALRFMDSLLPINKEMSRFRSGTYGAHSDILRALGQYDSAFHYLGLAHQGALENVEQNASARVAAIEAEYAQARDEQLIAEQRTVIADTRRRQYWMAGLGGLILCGLAVAAHYNRRLRGVNQALSEQSRLLHQRNDDLARSLRSEQLLLGEVHHRVKNNLQIIVGLLDRQMKDSADPVARANLESMAGRVYSISAVHQTLYQQGRLGKVNFRAYIARLTQHLQELHTSGGEPTVTLELEEEWFDLDTAIPLGTLVNELLTNSFKYAAGQPQPLHISIRLSREEEHFLLEYADNGPGYPAGVLQEREGGLGSYLLHGMSKQLGGYVTTTNRGGAVCLLRFRRKQEAGEPIDHLVNENHSSGR